MIELFINVENIYFFNKIELWKIYIKYIDFLFVQAIYILVKFCIRMHRFAEKPRIDMRKL